MPSEAAALEALLDAMRGAILAGNLAALGPLGERAEQALTAPPVLAEADARRLREKAQRNMVCLEAAARGVRAARRRLAEVEAAASGGLGTYDAHGQRAQAALPTLVQRV